jgi:hypothetical protein
MAYPLYNREKQVERSSSEGASERHYEIFDKFFSIKIQFPHRKPNSAFQETKWTLKSDYSALIKLSIARRRLESHSQIGDKDSGF